MGITSACSKTISHQTRRSSAKIERRFAALREIFKAQFTLHRNSGMNRQLSAMFPIIRIAMQVHNDQNEQFIGFNRIQNTIRKSPDQATPDIAFQNRPCVRINKRALYRCIYFDGEIITKSGFNLLVVVDRLIKFAFRIGVKLVTHFSNRCQILSKTSLPGIAAPAAPERISTKRW